MIFLIFSFFLENSNLVQTKFIKSRFTYFKKFLRLVVCKTSFYLFYPRKGLEGYLCPKINILGNIYNIDTPICTSDRKLLNDLKLDIFSHDE